MLKIMLIEDDPTIADMITKALVEAQFEPVVVTDFDAIMTTFSATQPHLVLLDINLPNHDGFYWVDQIRQESRVPVIFISSRTNNLDMITAMNRGGDDFVAKPFAMPVLFAKINALLRRTYDYQSASATTVGRGGLQLDLTSGTATVNNQPIDLSKTETQLLKQLLAANGQVVSRTALLKALWQDARFVDDNTLTVNINRLRKKISSAGLNDYIHTVINKGYQIP